MLLKQIEYFVAVVDTGSFSEAGERCFISQSAISQQIKALERELGTELFIREHRTFRLTPAGKLLYRKGMVILNDIAQLRREIRRSTENDREVLRIGYLKCYGGDEFQNAAAVFVEKYPDTELEIINGNHEELYDALRREDVDLVLNDQRRAFSDAYVNFELVRSHAYIEIAARHPFARLNQIEVSDLKNTPCILVAGHSQQETESRYYRDIVGLTGDHLYAETLPEARVLVAAGRGFLPVEGIREDIYYDRSVARIPLFRHGEPVLRNYCAFWKKEHDRKIIRDFAGILKEQFQ